MINKKNTADIQLPRIDRAFLAVANLEKNLTEDMQESVGWSEEVKALILTALEYYRQRADVTDLK